MPVSPTADIGRRQMSQRLTTRALSLDEVHIYATNLDEFPVASKELAAPLSGEERARAARFHFAHDRERYIARRGILRRLLGSYLEVDPRKVVLSSGRYGKPTLAPSTGGPQPGFNLSHSDGIALYAFAWNRRIGIDVERVRSDIDHRGLAARFFSPGEQDGMGHVSEADLPACFFACWTRKEAVVKARGVGLSLPLHTFEVSIRPEAEPRLVWVTPDPAENWRLMTVIPRPGYVGALAVEGPQWTAWVDLAMTPLRMGLD